MSELYPNHGVLEQPDRVNHLRRFKAWAWRGLVVAVIVAGSACACTATEQSPEPTSTVTPEPNPSPTATPLAEKLFGGDLTELTAEQAAHLDVWLPVMVSGLSRLAFNGFIDGKPLGAVAGSEVTGWSYQGYLVNLYPVEPIGVELHLQVDLESEKVALLPTIRNPESLDNGAVIVPSSTDSEEWNFAGDEPVIMKPQTENGAVQWSFDLETYVSVSDELEVTHFVDPDSGQWEEVGGEVGVDFETRCVEAGYLQDLRYGGEVTVVEKEVAGEIMEFVGFRVGSVELYVAREFVDAEHSFILTGETKEVGETILPVEGLSDERLKDLSRVGCLAHAHNLGINVYEQDWYEQYLDLVSSGGVEYDLPGLLLGSPPVIKGINGNLPVVVTVLPPVFDKVLDADSDESPYNLPYSYSGGYSGVFKDSRGGVEVMVSPYLCEGELMGARTIEPGLAVLYATMLLVEPGARLPHGVESGRAYDVGGSLLWFDAVRGGSYQPSLVWRKN